MLEGNLCAGSGQQSISKQLHLVVYFTLLCPTFSLSSSSPTPWRVVQRHRLALAHFNHSSLPLKQTQVAFITPAALLKLWQCWISIHPGPMQMVVHSPYVLSDNSTLFTVKSFINAWTYSKTVCVYLYSCKCIVKFTIIIIIIYFYFMFSV